MPIHVLVTYRNEQTKIVHSADIDTRGKTDSKELARLIAATESISVSRITIIAIHKH